MNWTETAGRHVAEGVYGRVYTITPTPDGRFTVEATTYIPGMTFTTVNDAKTYCRHQERKLAAG